MKTRHFFTPLTFILMSFSANSGYIFDQNFYTTVNTLDWLDVSLTQNLDPFTHDSIDDSLASTKNQLGTAGVGLKFKNRIVGKGWRRATGLDFERLMAAFGFVGLDDPCLVDDDIHCSNTNLGDNNADVNRAIGLFGDTQRANFQAIGDTAMLSGGSLGYLADDYLGSQPNLPEKWIAGISDIDLFRFGFASGGRNEYINYRDRVETRFRHASYGLAVDYGHWLVRDTQDPNAYDLNLVTSEVSEPGLLDMFLIGLSALMIRTRKD